MTYVLAGIVVVAFALFVIGAATGRARMKSCCSIADPRNDARMRAAYDD
ncbi:hypothetical protein BH09ACT10_BH09ACT10_24820 [soil metagenome]